MIKSIHIESTESDEHIFFAHEDHTLWKQGQNSFFKI
jgi:hypothetical protein